MTAPSLYQLTTEYTTLLHTLSDMDIDAQTALDTIESTGLQESIAERVQSRVFVTRAMRSHAEAIKAEIKRLTALAKHFDSRADALDESTLTLLQAAHIQRIDGSLMIVKVQNNPPTVDIFEPGLLPLEYTRTPPQPAPAPDKMAIKEALAHGVDIPGARIVQKQRLVIS